MIETNSKVMCELISSYRSFGGACVDCIGHVSGAVDFSRIALNFKSTKVFYKLS